VLSDLSGGNYEDGARSIGSLLNWNVDLFFRVVKDINAENSDFESIVTMLPLSTVDDIGKRIEILDLRLSNLHNYSEKTNAKKSVKAIQLISEYKRELESLTN
jgi:hypothetical protein